MQKTLALLLILAATTANAQYKVDRAEPVFDARQCAVNHTRTMCIVKAVAETRDNAPIKARTAVQGTSRQYVVVVPSPNWLRDTNPGDSDLMLVDDSANAIIEFTWLEGEQGDVHAVARQQLAWLTDAMGSEPTGYEVDSGPYENDGAIYRICYTTNRATGECQYSAAVNLDSGMVNVLSILSSDAALTQQVLDTIVSLDVTRPVDRTIQGDVLRMPQQPDQ